MEKHEFYLINSDEYSWFKKKCFIMRIKQYKSGLKTKHLKILGTNRTNISVKIKYLSLIQTKYHVIKKHMIHTE